MQSVFLTWFLPCICYSILFAHGRKVSYGLHCFHLVRFFISDVSTVEYGAVFTRLRCISLPFINIEFMLISVFQGIGGAKQALILSFFRKGIFDLPVMFLANLLWPMYGLMIVEPVMEFMGGSIAVFLYRRQAFVECRSST